MQHAAARRHRLLPARHDRPLHVQRPAAIAFVGGQTQVIDENGEGREREVLRQDDADAQRARVAIDGEEDFCEPLLAGAIERALNFWGPLARLYSPKPRSDARRAALKALQSVQTVP